MDAFVGEIRLFPYTYAPRGWALCNGASLPISQNAALYSLIGTIYGGDGRQSFKLPNLQGRITVSSGQGPGLSSYVPGQTGGATSVTLSSQQSPAHTHTLNAVNVDGTTATSTSNMPAVSAVGGRTQQIVAPVYAPGSTNTPLAPGILSSTGGGGAHNNMQPYLVMNYCICLQGIFPQRP